MDINNIRFEALQFDEYYDEDKSSYQSDENYFEMITSNAHYIEVNLLTF